MNPPQTPPFTYVDTEAALEPLVNRMRRARRVALDTEADSLHSYYEKVCLIQLDVLGGIYLVDPLSGVDLSRFLEVLSRKPLVFHSAEYDLRMLLATFRFRPREAIFDTMLAAQLLGHEQFGLSSLVERFFAVALSKSGRRSDWSRRPLTEAQQTYAAIDVCYLGPLADRFLADLAALGRVQWHRETCERMVEATARTNSRSPEHAWRIKGASKLDRRQLAFVREIWKWRENEAQRSDRPPFKIMGNQAILDLAVWAASHPRASLDGGPRLPRHCRGNRLAALGRAIRRARELAPARWPELRRPSSPEPAAVEPKELVDALRAESARIARDLQIAPSVLAPRAALVAVAMSRPRSVDEIVECSALMRWQARQIEPAIRCLLEKHPAP